MDIAKSNFLPQDSGNIPIASVGDDKVLLIQSLNQNFKGTGLNSITECFGIDLNLSYKTSERNK